MPPLVVPIASLRRAVGLLADDASEDESLLDLEKRAVAWVEEQFERRFREPIAHVEYRWGNGSRSMYLRGYIAEPEPEVGEALVIRDRAPGGEWEAFTPWELRNNKQLIRNDGLVWFRNIEYEISYLNGYVEAPGDIISLILDMVGTAYITITEGSAGDITSEKIGDYSYTIGGASSGGATGALSSLSSDSLATYHRWRQRHI